jgi:RNA polymerase sigma-70 factor (ECF subfamily)
MDDDIACKDDLLTELFIRHQRSVYRFMLRRVAGHEDDAIELTQETFWVATKSLPRLAATERAGAWLFAIARHVYVDFVRRRQRSKRCLGRLVPAAADDRGQATPHEIMLRRERQAQLAAALRQMERNGSQSTVELRYCLAGYSFAEIASLLGLSRNTVSTRVRRAKLQVTRRLRNESIETNKQVNAKRLLKRL